MINYKNNFFQSENFEEINRSIFNYKILNLSYIKKKIRIIYRLKKNSSKLDFIFSKSGIITEFRGFFEIWGLNFKNDELEEKDIQDLLINIEKYKKNFNPGLIIFKNTFIPDNKLQEVKKIFNKFNYEVRNWKTKVLKIEEFYKNNLEHFHKKTRKDIKIIDALNPKIIEVKDFNDYSKFLELFFNSEGHKDYPEQKNYKKEESWNILKNSHFLFILKDKFNYLGVFGIRIQNDYASLIMIGRNNYIKNSIHSYSINYLINFLKEKNIKYLDLTGFNPNPSNKKEEGIKFFKERFPGEEIDLFYFVKDNTYILKYLRKIINYVFKRKRFADENWLKF